jgi:hypothetical protein
MYPNYVVPEDTEVMKDCVHTSMIEKRNEKYSVDSFDAEKWIGAYVKNIEPTPLYKTPGEKSIRTIQTGKQIGWIKGFNANKNFAVIQSPYYDYPVYMVFTKPENFTIIARKGEGTPEELEMAAKVSELATRGVNPMAYVGKKTFQLAGTAAEGISETVQGASTILTAMFKNLKWILLAVLILVALYYFAQIKKAF